ncbi:MAG: amino acid permease [Bacteroidetes bacterium]|nr:amino acid permease [Bacteroidota bacterium]
MSENQLPRKINLLQASAINMIDMVGIGPFVVLGIVANTMGGPWFLYAWILGALLALADATIWSELGATFPQAGGSYNFLKEGYGPGWGKLMSFLFVWQTMIQAPLVIASAAIGFSMYAGYISPLTDLEHKIISGALVILIIFLLYRKIETIGKISVLLWIGVLLTMGSVIAGGLWHGQFLSPVKHINDGLTVNTVFITALSAASIKSIYSFLGYYNICHLGAEIKNPQKNIPRSMYISIAGITIFYLLMNISVASVLPMPVLQNSSFAVSDFMEALAGRGAANLITILILWVAFASVFSATLGYSRIPYAAAKDGAFFKVFARLHPTKNFPYISLLVLGAIAFLFSLLFRLSEVIDAIIAMRILVQFVGQGVGLLLLSKRKGRDFFSWRMPFFPVPAILAMLIWLAIFYATGWKMMLGGFIVISLGVIIYLLKSKTNNEWPFHKPALS